MKITEQIIKRLELWQKGGDRLVEIKLARQDYVINDDSSWSIWIYDFSLAFGCILNAENVDMDWMQLIINSKRHMLRREMELLDQENEKQGAIA